MNSASIPEVQPAEPQAALQVLPAASVSKRVLSGRSGSESAGSALWKWPLVFFGWCWRVLAGGLLCFSLVGSILVTGWTYRWMQGLVLRGWWKRSRFRQEGSFEDFCASLGYDAPVVRARWFLQERMGTALNRLDVGGRQPGAVRKILRSLRLPWHSLWLNFKIGFQGLFCTYLLTGLGCLIMLFSWEFGWLNSFNKGYEQALIGPLTGLLGILIFVAAMFYVPMAQVHQAVTGDFRAFFDVRFVWRLIQARLSVYVILSALIALISLPLEILKTAPAFFGDWTESWSDAEVERGWMTQTEVHPTLVNWLDRLDISPVPTLESAGLTYLVKSGSRSVYRRTLHVLLFFIWFGFVAKVYVGQFLNYHPFEGFMNHPLVQFPHFNYIPSDLKS